MRSDLAGDSLLCNVAPIHKYIGSRHYTDFGNSRKSDYSEDSTDAKIPHLCVHNLKIA